jgi:hypothetical protein
MSLGSIEKALHILLIKRLTVEVLVKVNLRVLGGERVVCPSSVRLVVLLPSDIEMMRRVMSSVLGNAGVLDGEICDTRGYEC